MGAVSGLPVLLLLVLTRVFCTAQWFSRLAAVDIVGVSEDTSLLHCFIVYYHYGSALSFKGTSC